MVRTSSYGRARGDFERASRAAFKTLDKGAGPSVLEALDAVQLAADHVRAALVEQVRADGGTWADVGELLGMTRQSAWQRFGSSDPE